LRRFGDCENVVFGDVLATCSGYGGREDTALPAQPQGTQGAVLGDPAIRLAADDEVEEAGAFEGGFEGCGEGGVGAGFVAGGAGAVEDAFHDGVFDSAPTLDLPTGGGGLVDEGGFSGGTRSELGDKAVEESFEFRPLRGGGRALGAATVAEGVHGGDGLALGGDGAAGLGAVEAGLLGSG
jgi:hypothetical protein